VLIRGGIVVDPSQSLHAPRDVRLEGDRVLELGDGLTPRPGEEVLEARGALVLPGLIDLHVHVFWGGSHYGIDPDPHCLASGTTTVADAGSAGAHTFPAFRRYVIEVARTRVLPFLNIGATGMLAPDVGELHFVQFIDRQAALRTIEAHRDLIQGIKVRLSREVAGPNARVALTAAREVSEAARLPIMVHVGDTPLPLTEILDELRGGDIITHCFHGRAEGILDARGRVLAEARRAAGRAVHFDVGHGKGSFAFAVARQALADGFRPGTISSDLHVYNVEGPVFDLATTMSKFLHLGLSLDEVVAMTTTVPAQALRGAAALGTLRPGAIADVTLLEFSEGRVEMEDAQGEKVTARQRLVPAGVIRNGVPVEIKRTAER
jgi:dihydroorotase